MYEFLYTSLYDEAEASDALEEGDLLSEADKLQFRSSMLGVQAYLPQLGACLSTIVWECMHAKERK
jgi:hypothetical protein